MNITAVSTLARAVVTARALVLDSPAFQQRVADYAPDGTTPADRAFIYQAELVESLAESMREMRPMAIIGLSDEIQWDALQPGCVNPELVISGTVSVAFVDNARFTSVFDYESEPPVAGPDKQGDSYIDFLNFSGGVLDDLNNSFGLDNVGFRGITALNTGDRTELDERQNDDFWISIYQFEFGDK